MILPLALVLAAAAPPAPAPTPAPAAALPEFNAVPAWLQVVPQASPDVTAIWEELSTLHALRNGPFTDKFPPGEKDIRMYAPRVRKVEPEGPLAGEWIFLGAEGASRPHAGYRLRWDGASGYRWIAELHCEPGAGCSAAQEHFSTLLAPAPPDPAQRSAWLDLVATEPCQFGAVRTPAPGFPSRALRQEAYGVVMLALLVNRCGDVRDAWVLESAGHPDLDNAAREGARYWKLKPLDEGRATATVGVPVSFLNPDG